MMNGLQRDGTWAGDKISGSLNNTEVRNTPFIKGYNLGFAECSTGDTGNNSIMTNMTRDIDGRYYPSNAHRVNI